MFAKEKISYKQLFLLVFGQGIAMFIVIGQFASKNVGRDVWISMLLAFALGIGLGYIIFKLGQQYPDQTILEYLPKIWGKFGAKVITIVFLINFFIISITIVRGPSGSYRILYMETPIIYTMILFAIMSCFALYKGLETFVKVNNFLAIAVLVSTIIFLVAIYPDLELIRVLPIMENGFMPVLNGANIVFGIVVNTALLIGLILPNVNEKKKGLKGIMLGFLCAGIFHVIIAITYIAFFDVELLENHILYPLYNLLRYVYVAEFIFGFEIILMIIWLAHTFFLYTGFFLPTIYTIVHLLKLNEYRSIIFPYAALIIALTTLMPSPVYNIGIYVLANRTLSTLMGVILVITFIISLIKNRKKSTREA